MNEKIVLDALQGKESAFALIYEQTVERAHKEALRIVKDEHDAWDVVQDAYIKMWQNLDTLQDPSKLESWFASIVRHKALDFLDSKEVKHSVTFSDIEAGAEDESFDYGAMQATNYREFIPEEAVDYQETQRILWGLVNELPDKQRECMLLRWRDNLKIKEISEVTGYPEATVKSCLNYGRKKLEEALKKLEKEGTKLYGITPLFFLPFLRWMLGAESTVTATVSAANAASTAGAVGTATFTGASASASARSASAAAGTAASGAAKVGLSLTIKQVIAGVCAAAVIGTGAVALGNDKSMPDLLAGEKRGGFHSEDSQGFVITDQYASYEVDGQLLAYEIPQITLFEPNEGINEEIYEFVEDYVANIEDSARKGKIRTSRGFEDFANAFCRDIKYDCERYNNVLSVDILVRVSNPKEDSAINSTSYSVDIDIRNGAPITDTLHLLDALGIDEAVFVESFQNLVKEDYSKKAKLHEGLTPEYVERIYDWDYLLTCVTYLDIHDELFLIYDTCYYDPQENMIFEYPGSPGTGTVHIALNTLSNSTADADQGEANDGEMEERTVTDMTNQDETNSDLKNPSDYIQLYQEGAFKGTYNDLSYKLPMFTIDSPDAQAVNQKILNEYGHLLEKVALLESEGETEPEDYSINKVEYQTWYTEGVVTLELTEFYHNKSRDIYATTTEHYSIYVDTGELVDSESIMSRWDMEEAQFYDYAAKLVEEDFVTATSSWDHYDDYYYPMVARLASREYLSKEATFYYDAAGNLMMTYSFHTFVGFSQILRSVKIG